MGGIGGQNPLPFQLGGGLSPSEKVYNALRANVGRRAGDAPIEPQGGIADAWRWAKAKAIAGVVASQERAAMQAFPSRATDRLGMYEDSLGLAQAPTDAERNRAAQLSWTASIAVDIPTLTASLQAIDPALSIDTLDPNQTAVVRFGRCFGSSSAQTARFPNYSSHFVLHVRYTIAPSMLLVPAATRAGVSRLLASVLPSWVDWTLYTSTGFLLDGGPAGTSLLDQTAFG